MLGLLDLVPALTRTDLLSPPVTAFLNGFAHADQVQVAEIDPALSDTTAFCERYGVGLEVSANCVVLRGKREGEVRTAAALVLATTRADVNGLIRKHLDVRKISFASMDEAVEETGMEYGGITPLGLPAAWQILVDDRVVATDQIVVGAGLRKAKLVVPGALVASISGVQVLTDLAQPLPS